MYNDCFDKYPDLKCLFDEMCFRRRNEILDYLKDNDNLYSNLTKNRVKQSMILRNTLRDNITVLEKYMDLVYEQQIYELDAIYKYAFKDALLALEKLKLLT